MESYLELSPCIFFSASDDRTIKDANRRLCTVLGYEARELEGQKLETIFTVPSNIFFQTHFFPLLKIQGRAEEIFIHLKTKEGEELPVLINAERVTTTENSLTTFAGIIVRNRKKFEEELIAARKAAERALHENTALVQAKASLEHYTEALEQQVDLVNRNNEQLRQFGRVMTHDLQEPLRKLTFFSNMITGDAEIEQHKLILEKIIRVTGQMRNVVHGLQQYVWLNDAKLNPIQFDLKELVLQVATGLEQLQNIPLHIEYQGPEAVVGDTEQLRVLIYQVLDNALRFRNGAEAFVSVSVTHLSLNKFRNIQDRYKYVEYCRVVFQDRGRGFKTEYRDQVFELFKRFHPDSGKGVGLALCRKIIDNHGGEISMDSKEGEGTSVTVLIPQEPLKLQSGAELETSIQTSKM